MCLLIALTSISIAFGQKIWENRAYEYRFLGSDIENARNFICSATSIISGSSRIETFNEVGTPYLKNKSIYEYTDEEGDLRYIYIVRSARPDTDRDYFPEFEMKEINDRCDRNGDGKDNDTEMSYYARDFGKSLINAKRQACSNNPNGEGKEFRLNTLVSSSSEGLKSNTLYEFTNDDNNSISYVYIIGRKERIYRDRDYYFETSFSAIPSFICDSDGDGVADKNDNCPFTANTDQKDTNGNGIGDVCEPPKRIDINAFKVFAAKGESFSKGDTVEFGISIKGNYTLMNEKFNGVKFILYFQKIKKGDQTENIIINTLEWNNKNAETLVFDDYTIVTFKVKSRESFRIDGLSLDFGLSTKYGNLRKESFDGSFNVISPVTVPIDPKVPFDRSDLVIDESSISIASDCKSCLGLLKDIGNKKHLLNGINNGRVNLTANVLNKGVIKSKASKVKVYRSNDKKFDKKTDVLIPQDFLHNLSDDNRKLEFDVPPINGLGRAQISVIIDSKSFAHKTLKNGNYTLASSDNYYLLLVLDDVEVTSIPIRYIKNFNANAKKVLNTEVIVDPQSLKIFDLTGKTILEKTILSTEEEGLTVAGLPQGLYIIKSGTKVYKLYKN